MEILNYLEFKKDGAKKKRFFVYYEARDKFGGDITDDKRPNLLEEVNLANTFKVCIRSPVMFVGSPVHVLANYPNEGTKTVTIVNGTIGEVCDFGTLEFVYRTVQEKKQGIIGRFPDGEKSKALQVAITDNDGKKFKIFVGLVDEIVEVDGASLTRTQYAVLVSYAMTVHKAQGQSFDNVHVLIKNNQFFLRCLFYVAISRVKSLSGLTIDQDMRIDQIDLRINNEVQKFLDFVKDNVNSSPHMVSYSDSRKRKLDDIHK